NSNFIIQEKNNYTKDILIPSNEAYGKFSKILILKKIKIKKNIYYRLIKDLLRLPSDIKHYFKGK
ncbi:alpha-2,3 sialyltransferase, partial [Campylobacter jejuni]|nr:alpha-2,3 sialyltransferase [Campylobacter jejuni]